VVWEKDHEGEPTYIQDIYQDGPNQIVQCFFVEALKYLVQQEVFEVDMSFKRVAGILNEVVFAKFVEGIEHS
jgi:hypothetical protein